MTGIWLLLGSTVAGIVIAYTLLNTVVALALRRTPLRTTQEPTLSILVAARNEQDNIQACLESLNGLEYPRDRLQILIGNDRSTDQTGALVDAYIADKPWFQHIHITETWPGIRMKQNVLAQLAYQATGELLLVTDADITHHPLWAQQMAAHFADGHAIVTGATVVDGPKPFDKMQALDWLQGVAYIKALDDLGWPITAVGNNMAITQKDYWLTGGYEHISFSITEDYKLFEVVRARGRSHAFLYNAVGLNRSAAIPNLKTLFNQRRRWFKGGSKGPPYALVIFGLHALAFPALVVAALTYMPLAWWGPLLGLKLLSDLLVYIRAAWAGGRTELLPWWPLHVFYQFMLVFIMPVYALLPGSVDWKGRKL